MFLLLARNVGFYFVQASLPQPCKPSAGWLVYSWPRTDQNPKWDTSSKCGVRYPNKHIRHVLIRKRYIHLNKSKFLYCIVSNLEHRHIECACKCSQCPCPRPCHRWHHDGLIKTKIENFLNQNLWEHVPPACSFIFLCIHGSMTMFSASCLKHFVHSEPFVKTASAKFYFPITAYSALHKSAFFSPPAEISCSVYSCHHASSYRHT